jgi:hypothetical protein
MLPKLPCGASNPSVDRVEFEVHHVLPNLVDARR